MGVHEELTDAERKLGDMLRSSFAELSLTSDQKQRHRLRLVQSSTEHRSTSINANGVAGAGRMRDVTSKPTGVDASVAGNPHPRFTRALEGAALLLIVLLVGAGVILARAWMPNRGSSTSGLAGAPRVSTVYAFQQLSAGAKLLPLEPLTLADQPSDPLSAPATTWAVSADGSTMVTFDYEQGAAIITVREGFTGPVRAHFSAPFSGLISSIMLDRDGSRMLVNRQLEPSQWFVIDATSGKLLMSLDTRSPKLTYDTPMSADSLQLSPDGSRLYRFIFTDRADATGPQPLRVISYDTLTGKQIATQTFPDIQAGAWRTGGSTEADTVSHYQQPGIAMSPDGREIALVRSDGKTVTMVDAANLTVERTMTLDPPAGFLERALRKLGIVPRPAAAKMLDGIMREAVFSPDGKTLYTWGDTITVDSTNGMQGLGFTRIDLKNGTTTQILQGALIGEVQPSPDGSSLYVTGYVPTAGITSPQHFVRRLDPTSLQTLAERSLTDVYEIELVTQRAEK
jgi:hypothetical protein